MLIIIHALIVGAALLLVVVYLICTDTLPAIQRHLANPSSVPISPMVVARLSLCGLACFLIVPIADLAQAFQAPWYWVAGVGVGIGFWAGRMSVWLQRL